MHTVFLQQRKITPSKVVCIGRNYAEHIAELNNETPSEPVIFNKPNSAITAHLYAGESAELHYESELSFIIEANKPVAVGFGLDLTKRDVQALLKSKGLPWERAKAFDRSAVFSQFVPIGAELAGLEIQLSIDGAQVQCGGYKSMIYKPQDILAEVCAFMTLADGDILMTGTPKGVGIVKKKAEFIGRVYDRGRMLIEQRWVAV